MATAEKAIKRQRRSYLGTMLIVALALAMQVSTLCRHFMWSALLGAAVSMAALSLYVVGLVDLRKHGDDGAKYIAIRRWALAAYIVALAIVSTIFN
jgi:hypothetical protein